MEARNKSFQMLKPPCVNLNQAALFFAAGKSSVKDVTGSLETLLHTLQLIAASNSYLDAKLADYVFIPISHVLRESQKIPVKPLELCLQCVLILLRRGWSHGIAGNLAIQLLILLSFLAGGTPGTGKLMKTSDELQETAYKCLSSLFAALARTAEGKEALVEAANVPALGHAITVLLDGIADGHSTDVQLSAVEALQALLNCVSDREALANVLPGIVSSLTKVLTPSTQSRRSFRVLSASLDILSDLFERVVSDQRNEDLLSSSDLETKGVQQTKLTHSWLKATAAQIKLALANVVKLRLHERIEVRLALLELCLTVLERCRETLADSALMMIETMVILSKADGDGRIIGKLKQVATSDQKVAELLRLTLHGWVMSLPRIMHSNDDMVKQRIIGQISTAFGLLADLGADSSLIDSIMAGNLRDSVANAVQGAAKIANVEEATLYPEPSTTLIASAPQNSSLTFESVLMGHKSQQSTIAELKILIRDLAGSKSFYRITNELLETARNSSGPTQLASLWLSLCILRSASEATAFVDDLLNFDTPMPNLHKDLCDDLYSFSISVLTDSISADEEPDWRLQALCLEAIALQASVQKADFRVDLVEALYPVVHLIGSPIGPLRSHAMTTLNILANYCDYRSASDLIITNVDYLVNAVALKLNTFDISPQAPMVLLMMIKLTGPALLPYLDDLVESIFAALECFHGYPKLVEVLFAVLKGVVEEGAKTPLLAITDGQADKHKKPPVKPLSIDDLIQRITTDKTQSEAQLADEPHSPTEPFPRRPWKDHTTSDTTPMSPAADDDDDDEPPASNNTPSDPAPPPTSKTFTLLTSIARLTQHHLPSSSPSLRLSLLSLLCTALPPLSHHDDTFLPLLHTLWPILLDRLADPEDYVQAAALDTMAAMCRGAGDFTSERVTKLWPTIGSMLRRVQGAVYPPSSPHGTRSKEGAARGQITYRSAALAGRQSQASRSTALVRSRKAAYVPMPTLALHKSLIGFLLTALQYVRLELSAVDEAVEWLAPEMLAGGGSAAEELRRVLEGVNPDAVWAVEEAARGASGASGDGEEGEGEGEERGMFWRRRAEMVVEGGRWDFVDVVF